MRPITALFGVCLLGLSSGCGSSDDDDHAAAASGDAGGGDATVGSLSGQDAGAGVDASGAADGAVAPSDAGSSGDASSGDGGVSGIARSAFGMHILEPSIAWPTVPFGGLRFWDNVTSWSDVEGKDAGVYDWSTFDLWLAQAAAHDAAPMYTFGRPPPWASSDPTGSSPYGPGESAPPASSAVWDQWVTTVVDRSVAGTGAHFDAYEMWNEPNGQFWSGTVAQLETFAASAYPLVHQHDPAATVLTPAVSNINPGGDGNGDDWLDQYLSAGGGAVADVVSVHGYLYDGGSTCTYRLASGSAATSGMCADQLATNLAALRTMLAKHTAVAGKPLWISETSWNVDGNTPAITDLGAQAAFLAQYYLVALSSGVARVYWYGWDFYPYGQLWDSTAGAHPAAVAYTQIIDWLVGATFAAPCASASHVWTCALTLADGSAATAVWKTDGAGMFSVPAGLAHARDITGATTAASGTIAVDSRPLLLVP